MRRRIPSTHALVAFESAARHQSFTLAGEELALTQSAIGRQVAALEELVGVQLFRRTRRGVTLTDAGHQYSRTVRQRLGEVEKDALDLAARSAGGGSVDLGVVPTFATHWLMPRLAGFRASHPEVQVNLHVRTRPFLFADSGLDAAIHAGEGGWPGTRADLLMPEPMIVVCAPGLLGRRKLRAPADLALMPLIHMTTRPDAWRRWFLAHGVTAGGDRSGPGVELFSMGLQAAIHGLGLALVPAYVAQEEIRRGLLCSPVREASSSGRSYYLIYPEGGDTPEALRLFRDWLSNEAALSA